MAAGRRARLLTLAVAGVGVLLGHWLAYLVELPEPAARGAVLEATGHGYLGVAGELASALLAFSIVGAFLRSLVDPGGEPVARERLPIRLTLLQVGAFVTMEAVERLIAGAPLADLVGGDLLSLGVVANIAVALVGSVVLSRILRLADRVAAAVTAIRSATMRRRTTIGAAVVVDGSFPRHRPATAEPVRGPPSPVLG